MDVTASYVICATPRTGSYLLCEALAATGIAGRPTEHLSVTYQNHWQRQWKALDYQAYIDRVLAEGSTANGVFGTKLHPHQLDHVLQQVTGLTDLRTVDGRAVMERLLPKPRWVFLTRRDRIAQAVSYTRAMQTNMWWNADFDPAPPGRPMPENRRFDVAEIEGHRRLLLRWERRWRSWFAETGIEPHQILYEDLVADLPRTTRKLLRFLGLSLPREFTFPRSRLRKQADDSSLQWSERYAALQAAKRERVIGAFAQMHNRDPIVVCGCGGSLTRLDRTNERVTIGVNDVGRAFTPNYHVIVDNPDHFASDRWEHVRATRADVVFTNQFLDMEHPFIVRMALRELPQARLPDRTSAYVIARPWYSPYVATAIAGSLGADPIGLIGVDFSDDHFFATTGPYSGIRHLSTVDEHFRSLRQVLTRTGQRLANLSTRSRLTALPTLEIADFDCLPRRLVRRDARRSSNIVVYDATASVLSGLLARCIWAQTSHHARFVHGPGGDEVLGWPDLDWSRDPDAVTAEIELADLVLLAGQPRDEHRALLEKRAVLALDESNAGPTVRLGETVVPTPLPAWSQRCRPDERDGVVNVLLCGASTELPRLAVEEAAISAGVEIRLVDTRTDPLEKVAKLRRRAHVVVDAAASGPWVESLAGLATGAVVLNTLAGQSQALRELRYYGGSDPFEHFNARRLVPILRGVLETGIASLLERGAANRQWIQTRWEFAEQWQRWWLPPIAAAVRRHRWEMTDG